MCYGAFPQVPVSTHPCACAEHRIGQVVDEGGAWCLLMVPSIMGVLPQARFLGCSERGQIIMLSADLPNVTTICIPGSCYWSMEQRGMPGPLRHTMTEFNARHITSGPHFYQSSQLKVNSIHLDPPKQNRCPLDVGVGEGGITKPIPNAH